MKTISFIILISFFLIYTKEPATTYKNLIGTWRYKQDTAHKLYPIEYKFIDSLHMIHSVANKKIKTWNYYLIEDWESQLGPGLRPAKGAILMHLINPTDRRDNTFLFIKIVDSITLNQYKWDDSTDNSIWIRQ